MPALLISGTGLVKTRRFTERRYVGDAINSARIFNQMEVDELVLFDLDASARSVPVQFDLVGQIVSECFMPICYGGGVKSLDDFRRLYFLGVEKISVSSLLFEDPDVVRAACGEFGSQSVVATLDVRRSRVTRKPQVCTHNGRRPVRGQLEDVVREVVDMGVGELIINDVDRDGTWTGFDCELVARVERVTNMPIVAMGGAGTLDHIREVVEVGNASAVALGSMAVFQAKDMGVLINFPSVQELERYVGQP